LPKVAAEVSIAGNINITCTAIQILTLVERTSLMQLCEFVNYPVPPLCYRSRLPVFACKITVAALPAPLDVPPPCEGVPLTSMQSYRLLKLIVPYRNNSEPEFKLTICTSIRCDTLQNLSN